MHRGHHDPSPTYQALMLPHGRLMGLPAGRWILDPAQPTLPAGVFPVARGDEAGPRGPSAHAGAGNGSGFFSARPEPVEGRPSTGSGRAMYGPEVLPAPAHALRDPSGFLSLTPASTRELQEVSLLTTSFRFAADRAAPGLQSARPGVRFFRLSQRIAAAVVASLLVLGAGALVPRPAYAAYNCVNVVLRDPYWGRYRGIVESGWNAAGIGAAFARNGFAVDGTPSVGAIMVWPAGYYGASGTGHVGVVAAVHGTGSVLVRHENWPYGAAEHAQVFTVRPGHQFVHKIVAVPAVAAAAEAPETEDEPAEEVVQAEEPAEA
ncbi:MAG: CHAP domain-containing protein [Chloroflexi bacterium]|nr:CHAP domain-containing protein [Chloroflexota bacterium]